MPLDPARVKQSVWGELLPGGARTASATLPLCADPAEKPIPAVDNAPSPNSPPSGSVTLGGLTIARETFLLQFSEINKSAGSGAARAPHTGDHDSDPVERASAGPQGSSKPRGRARDKTSAGPGARQTAAPRVELVATSRTAKANNPGPLPQVEAKRAYNLGIALARFKKSPEVCLSASGVL